MSQPQNGRPMDRPEASGVSEVRRARERAEAGVVRDDRQGGPTARPLPQALLDGTGPAGTTISRPTQIPQWPLRGPVPPAGPPDSRSDQQQTATRQQPPRRPPRPSRVPSILDSSRVQDPIPDFKYQIQNARDSEQESNYSVPPIPPSVQTTSSTASISDFPMPLTAGEPAMPPFRRSVTLGPPPSSRRGASSFYSNVSFVSPIPEESPRTRSYTSLASSTAIPESWGTSSPGNSPGYSDAPDGDTLGPNGEGPSYGTEDGIKIVRSASIGKRGKPQIVMNKGASSGGAAQRGADRVMLGRNPFADSTELVEASSSESSSSESLRGASKLSIPPRTAAGTSNFTQSRNPAPSPPHLIYNRLSTIKRPPRLDMEAVEKANARGSLTSLPDLIRRATRLAAMIDRGKRPGSDFEDLDYPEEKTGGVYSDRFSGADDRRQSGLSDMLAAFPPPAQAISRGSRVGSWFRNTASWPLPPSRRNDFERDGSARPADDAELNNQKRKYCGLPPWGLILVILIIVGIIAAAILVPLQFFVFNNRDGGSSKESAVDQCRNELECENGGTNVVTRDVCSCICTNGFTGSTCAVAGSSGCTTTRLVNLNDNTDIDNVTLGQAIPRLIMEAQGNFSVPLSGTTILARFNTDSLSCNAQNSLVTFDGRSGRAGAAQAAFQDGDLAAPQAAAIFVSISVITVFPRPTNVADSPDGLQTMPGPGFNFVTPRTSGATTTTVTTTLPSSTAPEPTATSATFGVTEDVLDFARVAVLFILQEDGVADASRAQSVLQRFFTASDGNSRQFAEKATNLDLGNGNAIDLVNFRVDAGTGVMGGRPRRRALSNAPLVRRACRRVGGGAYDC